MIGLGSDKNWDKLRQKWRRVKIWKELVTESLFAWDLKWASRSAPTLTKTDNIIKGLSVLLSFPWIGLKWQNLSKYIKTQKRDKSLLLAAPSRREAAHWWPHLSPNFPHTSSSTTTMPPSHSTGSPTPHSQMSRLLSPLVPISSSSSPDSSVLAYLDFHDKERGPKTESPNSFTKDVPRPLQKGPCSFPPQKWVSFPTPQ